MEHKWLIIALVIMSLVGSIAWAMPTPLQRAQGKLRALAMQKGIRVNIAQLQQPRQKGSVEAEKRLATSYTVFRDEAQAKQLKQQQARNVYVPWQLFRLNGLATEGLPEGWCWQLGTMASANASAPTLNATQQAQLTALLDSLPRDVYAIASNIQSVAIYWNEQGTPDDVERVYQCLLQLQQFYY